MSDRDFVSRQEEPVNKDNAAGNRTHLIGRGMAARGWLTDNEPVHVEGRTDRIAGLIHEHCCKSRDDA
jgi:uncharacterized protein YjbJ (UPF0337 family)